MTALDSAGVLEVARENAVAAGVAHRFECLAGSALDTPFGSGYDVVLLVNFLQHFDRGTCRRLLLKAHDALTPGGRVVTLDFIPDEDRVAPPIPALFSLTMLVATLAGDAHTFAELKHLYAEAGFKSTKS